MAAVRFPRLPASPVENSLEGRAFVYSGFAVAVLAIVLYGQDYVIPATGLATTAVGHVVSYRGREKKRRLGGQVLLATLVFAGLAYFLAEEGQGGGGEGGRQAGEHQRGEQDLAAEAAFLLASAVADHVAHGGGRETDGR